MRKILSQLGVMLADVGLLGILILNLLKLRVTAIRQAEILQNVLNNPGQLLTNDPSALLEKIRDNGVPTWAWLVNWGGIAITVLFLVVWIIWGQKSFRPWLFRFNLIWILLWVAYFVVTIIWLLMALISIL